MPHDNATAPNAEEVLQRIAGWLAEFDEDGRKPGREVRFADLDIDSLDLVEVAEQTRARWGATLEVTDVKDLQTVGEFVDLVLERAR